MRLVFFGTGIFAVPALKVLSPHVVLVVSQPDRMQGRGMRLQASPMKQAALELGLPVAQPVKARATEFIAEIQALGADALVVASYGQILSQSLLDAATRGGINLHGSILPRYRGAAPIQRCLMAGDAESGVSLMQMDKGMDTGDVIEIRRLAIENSETYGELQLRLAELAARMTEEWMPRIVAGNYPRVAQDSEHATMAPKLDKIEGYLSVRRGALEEHNRYRGVTPNPGATLSTDFGLIKVLKASLGTKQGDAGVVLETKSGLEVGFADGGSLVLDEVQPEGKKKTSGRDYANGLRLKPGSFLISPT